jgi:hypothetical protein
VSTRIETTVTEAVYYTNWGVEGPHHALDCRTLPGERKWFVQEGPHLLRVAASYPISTTQKAQDAPDRILDAPDSYWSVQDGIRR